MLLNLWQQKIYMKWINQLKGEEEETGLYESVLFANGALVINY